MPIWITVASSAITPAPAPVAGSRTARQNRMPVASRLACMAQ